MASTLILTFTDTEILQDENITVFLKNSANVSQLLETFKITRSASKQIPILTGLNPYSKNLIAGLYQQYFVVDYSSRATATVLENVVTLTVTNTDLNFNTPTGTAIDNGGITFVINNVAPTISKTVTIDSYSENVDNRCTKAEANLLVTGGSNTYNVYLDDVLTVSNETSPISVIIDRGISQALRVVDDSGLLIDTVTTTDTRRFISDDISVAIENYATGSTLIVTTSFISSEINQLEFSLDGVTYQSLNVFTGQIPATYNIYVKDGFGCITTKQIVVDGVTVVTDTIFSISAINALRFSLVDENKKNQLNTLSFNELRITKYTYYQQYLENEVIPTQFKTNANYINCISLDKDGNTNTLTPIKKTENIGLKAKSTSTFFDLGSGRSGIYFGVVDSLDFTTENVIETLNYGFALPEWANKEGALVTIDGIGQVPIDSIGYSDEKSAFILEFNISYTGNDIQDKIISAEYNLQPYEIYEFNTTITKDLNVVIQVGTASDDIKFTYVSECVKMVDDSDFLFDITYWDDENKGGMNYQTGIRHKLRLNGYQNSLGEQETEGYNGDVEFYVTDNVIYDVQSFKFERLSTQMAEKLRMVVAHKYLLINGLFYKLSESPEVEGSGVYNLKNIFRIFEAGGDLFLTTEQENITNTSINAQLLNAVASAQGKAVLSWTKNI